ncbi:uncharacterized protein [Watersipora subatra]|uniref:uncharacterized protein n=1 Tax=Watersipora subatra TaxID=2589382 RepID=UPI00355AE921
MLWSAFLLLFLLLSSPAVGSHLDDQMKDMADDIGTSLRSISSAHNHKVDWLFVVDHGGFTNDNMRLQYSNFFVQQLATNLYISPMNSQAGVLTYGATTNLQIPLDVSDGNQCEFNKMVNKLVLTAGQSDMNQGLSVR